MNGKEWQKTAESGRLGLHSLLHIHSYYEFLLLDINML